MPQPEEARQAQLPRPLTPGALVVPRPHWAGRKPWKPPGRASIH